jgi:3-isopropylmalate dehydratase small subunit
MGSDPRMIALHDAGSDPFLRDFDLTFSNGLRILLIPMGKEHKLNGRVWVIKSKDGTAIDSIDTDQIFHNRYLTITEMEQMKEHAFSNLEGWNDFPAKAKPGDMLVVGKNFGAGSSRQQAVDCFIALGIQAIIGESFGAIYRRNAINSGFPILEFPEITRSLSSGDLVEVDLLKGSLLKTKTAERFQGKSFSQIQWKIYEAGGIFKVRFDG